MTEHKVQLDQINYKGHVIAVGHPVRVLPTKKGGRDGYDALVKRFHGLVTTNDDGTKRGRVNGIEVTDPKSGNNRILGPERIVPYLGKVVEAKAAALAERKKILPFKAPAKKEGASRPARPSERAMAAAKKITGPRTTGAK